MWFDEVTEVFDMFKASFPASFLFFIPIFIIISPAPASAAHEFAVHRMQQFDLQGSPHGCRNTLVNVEARPLDSKTLVRRCPIAKFRELTIDKFKSALSQNAGGMLVLLPSDITSLSAEDKQLLLDLEQDLLEEETSVPVYFATETPELLDIYENVQSSVNSDQAGSATEALFSTASANGYQMVINGPNARALTDYQIDSIYGKLSGYGIEEQLPTVALVAHYDAFGVAPGLSYGADSNGSGVAMLLELMRLFSKLYTNSRTHAKFNILFFLSGGGKFNYQGTKKWIEESLDSAESSLLTDVAQVVCLDTVGAEDVLYLHVSKPPKEGSVGDIFMQNLQRVIQSFSPEVKLQMVHKKINLAQDVLSWEHERFSIRRLPAYTLSHLSGPTLAHRTTLQDDRSKVDIGALSRNTKLLAESLARHIYNFSQETSTEVFKDALRVQPDMLDSWMDVLTAQPRATQLLPKGHRLLATLEQAMSHYLKDVRRVTLATDNRDPDFLFYDGSVFTMYAYSVKPAIFDLFLALAIAGYIGLVWLLTQNFHLIRSSLTVTPKVKAQ